MRERFLDKAFEYLLGKKKILKIGHSGVELWHFAFSSLKNVSGIGLRMEIKDFFAVSSLTTCILGTIGSSETVCTLFQMSNQW